MALIDLASDWRHYQQLAEFLTTVAHHPDISEAQRSAAYALRDEMHEHMQRCLLRAAEDL